MCGNYFACGECAAKYSTCQVKPQGTNNRLLKTERPHAIAVDLTGQKSSTIVAAQLGQPKNDQSSLGFLEQTWAMPQAVADSRSRDRR
jgi:hypothetical protein